MDFGQLCAQNQDTACWKGVGMTCTPRKLACMATARLAATAPQGMWPTVGGYLFRFL